MDTSSQKPFVLVDGSSYLYRAFHALPPLTNSQGEPTGAMYGVINMLRKLIKDYAPEHIVVVFDAKGKTFRDDMYPEYKANRPPMPEDLVKQVQPLHDIIEAMGLPMLSIEGVEADDVIGTLVVEATRQGQLTLVSTGDKDLAQLVNDHVTLVNTMTDTVMDIPGVKKKFGIGPELIIDYLALIGDKVDNVPGVPKVGPKTAVKWLEQYGSLDNIMQHADEVKGKIGENLRSSLDTLPLSKQLVTIKKDVALNASPNNFIPKEKNNEKLVALFKRYEFKKWLTEAVEGEQQKVETHYDTVLDESEFNKWIDRLKQARRFSFDTETTSLNYMNAEIVGVSFSINKNEAAYVPVAHDYEDAPKQLSREFVLNALAPVLEDSENNIVAQNLKYDMNVLANYDIKIDAQCHDTMLQSYILNSSSSRHDMDTLALKYLGRNTIHFEDVAGKGAKQKTFNEIHLDQASPYAAEDADITLQLHHTLMPQVEEVAGLKRVYDEIEMPLVPVLSRIERNGVLIDANMLAEQSGVIAKRLDELEHSAHEAAGEVFNLGSTKQLQVILYEKMKLPVLSKTPKGAPSTAEAVLQELAHDYPFPKLILEYRSLSKLKSTYTDSLPKAIHPKTGRVHTSYNQAVTATGRLSSTDPNLQNIPARTEEGRKIRRAFIAPRGYKILAADYSQIELRIMAHLTQDAGLLKAFANNHDIHSATAAEVFGVSIENVNSDQRRKAKAINFGLIYGMSAFGLSKQLGIERHVAQEYIDIYFQRYPGIKKYMDETRALAHKQAYVETFFGRRLYLPEINASNMMRQRAAERAAINAPMQGTAADIIKFAMIKLDHWLSESGADAKMIMQVHDELVLEIAEKDVDRVKENVDDIMTHAATLSVSLDVHVGVADNWEEAHS